MKEIKVLGTGCKKCIKVAEIIVSVAQDLQVKVNVVKETNPEVIMSYGVMSTPAVIVDEVNVHSGSIPDREAIESWLEG